MQAGLIVCDRCDGLHRRVPVEPGEAAHCTTCGALIASGVPLDVDRSLALAVAALALRSM